MVEYGKPYPRARKKKGVPISPPRAPLRCNIVLHPGQEGRKVIVFAREETNLSLSTDDMYKPVKLLK